jgi:hypothetical protein
LCARQIDLHQVSLVATSFPSKETWFASESQPAPAYSCRFFLKKKKKKKIFSKTNEKNSLECMIWASISEKST